MLELNRALFIGNLTGDPDLRYDTRGTPVCTVGLALHRQYRTRDGTKREDTCFVDVEVFGAEAERFGNEGKKGNAVLIDGRLRMHQWKDRRTGSSRSRIVVLAETPQLL